MMGTIDGPSPSVSVVMAVYNGEAFVGDAIDSILGQTFPDFEFIIVNDASTDGTQAILSEFKDPRIRFIYNQDNQGLTHSLMVGIGAARGEYVARMDADDRSHPQRLEKQIVYLKAHPDVILIGCNLSQIDYRGRRLGKAVALPETDAEIRQKLPEYNCFAHGTAIFRKDIFDQVGGYRPGFQDSQDYDLWLRMLPMGKLANHRGILYEQRVHPDMKSVKYLDRQHAFHALAQELHDIRIQHGDDDIHYHARTKEIMEAFQGEVSPKRQRQARSVHLLRLGIRYISKGYIFTGVRYTLHALWLNPLNPALLREIQRRRVFLSR